MCGAIFAWSKCGLQQNMALVKRPSISIYLGSGRRSGRVIHSDGHPSIHPSIYAMQQVMQRSSLTRTMEPLSALQLLRPQLLLPGSCMHLALQTIFAVVVVFTQQTTSGSGRAGLGRSALHLCLLLLAVWESSFSLFRAEQSPNPIHPRPEQTNMLCLKRTYWTYSCCCLLLFLMLFVY